jgi:hypothetical protein
MQMWDNLKVMMCTKFAKTHHQEAVTAKATGHASANNMMEEYAAATEELIENLTEKHDKQIKALIKSNTDTMTKLLASMKSTSPVPAGLLATMAVAATSNKMTYQVAKHKVWVEKCKSATQCPHNAKTHPDCTHDQCWELEANAAKRPTNWKFSKVA